MDANKLHITFPLDSFLQRLELAGFYISPAQRLQLLRVLQTFGQDHLRNLDKLKYRLCPIVSRNEQEQLRFYDLFDTYIQEIQAEDWQVSEPEPQLSWWQKIPRWLWALGLLVFFGPIVYTIISTPGGSPETPLIIQSEHSPQVSIQDTAHFINRSANYDSSLVAFQWKIIDEQNGEVEDSIHSTDWHYPIRKQGYSPRKKVLLIASDTAVIDTFTSNLLIRCSNPPQVEGIIGPDRAEVRDTVSFSLQQESEDTFTYSWAIDTDSLSGSWLDDVQDQNSGVYVFAKPGVFIVRVEITRVGVAGFCQIQRTHRIVVGGDRVFLDSKPLEKDSLNTLLSFSLGTWILLSLLGVYIFYQWMKWLTPPPTPPDQEKKKKKLQSRFASNDKGPYFIPFRNRSGLIRIDPAMFRLADILRQRQEGLRMELDVPRTVQRTVEQGGFPAMQLRHTTIPSEYLFLIDEQTANSHQSNLYAFLAQFLRDKDVHVSTFRYQTEFDRFWNVEYREGVSLEQLKRLYPHHRLMILGDAHGLLNIQADKKPGLKERYAKSLRRWKNRLLLTPLPATDWTYREGALYEHFPVFCGDIEGFQSAMAFLELSLAEEENIRPDFDRWQTQMAQEHPQPAINYRRWNRLETYKDYLRNYPSVYQWLTALAVYPTPNWEITIAIGRALEPKGVVVNFDNLLLLSRIPWLQGQPISPKLRFAWLNELDAESEQLARQAVKEELDAVAPLVAASHANAELQTNLVIQNFVIDPHDSENRSALQHLNEQGLLNKKHRAELDTSLERRADIPENDIDTFLNQPDELATRDTTKTELIINHHFYKALLSSLLFLLLGAGIWNFGGTNTFYKMVLGEYPRSISADSTDLLRDYFFVKETTYIDSAIVYNNTGVDLWREAGLNQGHQDTTIQKEALSLFEKAIDYRKSSEYLLGRANKGRLYYQIGTDHYHHYLETFSPLSTLNAALPAFRSAAKYAATLGDGIHGQGLVHWYRSQEGNPTALDSANYYYQQLQVLEFFDTLSLRPNLETLLFPDRCPGLDYEIPESSKCNGGLVTVINRTNVVDQQIQYYFVDWGDGQADSLANFETLQHNYNLQGCSTLNVSFRLRARYQCVDGRSGVTEKKEELILLTNPEISINVAKPEFCTGEAVKINLRGAVCEGAQYTWDFGDGFVSNEINPSHIYSKPGNYNVRASVVNSCGEANSTLTVRVNDCGKPVNTLQLVAIDSAAQQTIAGVQLRWSGGSGITDLLGSYLLTYQEGSFKTLTVTATALGYETLRQVVDFTSKTPQTQQKGNQLSAQSVQRLYLTPKPKALVKVYNGLKAMTQDQSAVILDMSVNFTPENSFREGELLSFLEAAVARAISGYAIRNLSELTLSEIALAIRTSLAQEISKTNIQINSLNLNKWEEIKATLPRELTNLSAISETEGIRLRFEDGEWTSATQYEIEYSSNGASFETIFSTRPTPSKSTVLQQEYLHRNAQSGLNSYRFIRNDQNSARFVSKILTAEWAPPVTIEYEPFLNIEMVRVDGGVFTMGCDEKLDRYCAAEEQPPHQVRLLGFYLGKYEITNEQFAEFLKAKGNEQEGGELWYQINSKSAGIEEQKIKNRNTKGGGESTTYQVKKGYEDVPVAEVSFYGARAFCQWLSQETGQDYRLPTEAEWEYAARGGLAGAKDRYNYAGSDQVTDVAWHDKNARRRVHSIQETNAALKPNALSIFNMSGNVYEWCLDCWNPNYNGAPDTGAARQDGDCSIRVIRGGAWDQDASKSRLLHRGQAVSSVRSDYIGFRVYRRL